MLPDVACMMGAIRGVSNAEMAAARVGTLLLPLAARTPAPRSDFVWAKFDAFAEEAAFIFIADCDDGGLLHAPESRGCQSHLASEPPDARFWVSLSKI
jgi:hypothetical protein